MVNILLFVSPMLLCRDDIIAILLILGFRTFYKLYFLITRLTKASDGSRYKACDTFSAYYQYINIDFSMFLVLFKAFLAKRLESTSHKSIKVLSVIAVISTTVSYEIRCSFMMFTYS